MNPKHIRKIKAMADTIEAEQSKMANKVREGAAQSKEGFETVLAAIHVLNNILFVLSNRLHQLAKDLENAD